MSLLGHIQNGIVVFDEPQELPNGTPVRVEMIEAPTTDSGSSRQGGQYAGQIWIAPDFDDWPDDIKESFGMTP